MKSDSDITHIDRVLDGDISAFAPLVDRHKDMVFSIVLNILKNREDAEEISQDVFLKAYRKLDTFRRDSKFSTWLYRIAYNAAISGTRKKKYLFTDYGEDNMEELPDENTTDEPDNTDDELQLRRMRKALETLAPGDNTLIALFYMNNSSIEEISEITGLSQSNVKVKLHRIRKKLLSEMKSMANMAQISSRL